jgi:hypothetical protein
MPHPLQGIEHCICIDQSCPCAAKIDRLSGVCIAVIRNRDDCIDSLFIGRDGEDHLSGTYGDRLWRSFIHTARSFILSVMEVYSLAGQVIRLARVGRTQHR